MANNRYLEKIALTRLVSELAKGKVNRPLYKLIEDGFLRKPGVYAKGMRKGNDILTKKINSGVYTPKYGTTSAGNSAVNLGGYGTLFHEGGSHIVFNKDHSVLENGVKGVFPNRQAVSGLQTGLQYAGRGIKYSKQEKELIHQAGIRHEVFEADSFSKSKNKISEYSRDMKEGVIHRAKIMEEYGVTGPKESKNAIRLANHMSYPQLNGIIADHTGVVGMHHSLGVLGKESEIIRKNPYLHQSSISKIRKLTGEDRLISDLTGKRYGVDKITGKDLRKLESVKPTETLSHGVIAHKISYTSPT